MKKLLSLLTITLTAPVPLSVIACGGTTTPPVVDETDYLTLAQTAKEKIQTEFANLVDTGLNLRRIGDVTGGSAIMTYLKQIGQTADTVITQTASKDTIDGFLEILNFQVLTISNNLAAAYPELKPLFNGINPNDILKINRNNLDTILTNKIFAWQNNDFGLASFDASKAPYNVTDWYYLTANLQLDFTCLDENAKSNTSTISQNYDMYFANDGSDLRQVVTVISTNVQTKLDAIKSINLDYPQWNESFANQTNDVLLKINSQLRTQINIPNLTINTQAIANPSTNDYNFMNEVGTPEGYKDDSPLILKNCQAYVNTSNNFNNAWNPIIAKRENNFVSRLDTWKANNHLTITNQDNVFVFGDYKTTNWNISGLEIKTLSLPYYITSTNTTRANNTSASLTILEKLYVGPDALFQYGKNYDNNNNATQLNFYLKPDAYDDFRKRDVTTQTIYDYVTTQTINAGKTGNFIKDTDKVQWTTSGSTDWLSKTIKETGTGNFYFLQNHQCWRLVINGNAFSMTVQNYDESIWYYGLLTKFSFTRGDTKFGI